MSLFPHRLLLLVLLSITCLPACTIITGKGPIIEKNIPTNAFNAIQVAGDMDVSIVQASNHSIVIATQENIFQYVESSVLNGVLYLSLKPGTYMRYDLNVRIGVPTVSKLKLDGSGDVKVGAFSDLNKLKVTLDGSGDIEATGLLEVLNDARFEIDGSGDIDMQLKATEVIAVLDGSGDITLEGEADQLTVNLYGSGDVDARNLRTIQCEANLKGSGTIRIHAKELLRANLHGSGDIRYSGKPKVEASIDGSGVIKAD